MRVSVFIIFLSLVFTNAFSQIRNEDKDRIRISQNKILKSIQWTHKYVQGKANPNGYITTETNYDKKGNPVEVVNYKSTGIISSKLNYKYDQNNNKIEFIQYQKLNKPDLEVAFKQAFQYDNNGNKKIEVGFDGATGYTINYSYLSDNKPKDIIKYNSSRVIIEKWEYSYSDNIQTINIFKMDKLDRSIIRKFDTKGNITEEVNKNSAGKELQKTTNDYNSENLLTSSSEYFSGKLVKKLVYKYNTDNQITEITQINPDNSKTLNRSNSYDNQGNLIEEKWFDGIPDDLSSRKFKYDKKSNVIEVETYYSDYKYKVLYKFNYEYY